MNDLFEFLLFAVPIAGGLSIGWHMARKKIAELRRQLATQSERVVRRDVEKSELEDRLRVLERIVTDRGYTVSEEIEALRDGALVKDSGRSNDSGVPLNLSVQEKA